MKKDHLVRARPTVETDVDVLTAAYKRVEVAFERFDNVIVSFSGGKDSTIVLEIALDVAEKLGRLPLDVVHYDEEAIPYETEHYVRRRADDPRIKMQWLCAPVKHYNGCSGKQPWWSPWDPNEKEKWVRQLPDHHTVTTDLPGFTAEEIGKLAPEDRPTIPEANSWLLRPETWGNVAVLMGIRADESIIRHRAVVQRKVDNYIIANAAPEHGGGQGNCSKVYPIYDMSDVDLWTIVKQKGWDYNSAYDIMEAIGIPRIDQRCAPPFGTEPMRALWTFAVAFPDIWDKMQTRVAGAATAARYAHTELYAYGKIDKPEHLTWEEAITQALQKHDDEIRTKTAARIKTEIKGHYRKTDEPILEVTTHPDTGVSWKYLYMLAVRSDPKNRKTLAYKTGNEKWREKYDAELARLKATGRIQGTKILVEPAHDEGGTR